MFVPVSGPRIVYLYTCQTQSMEVRTCGACGFALDEILPRRPDVFHMPCCKRTVHRRCWTDERICPSCWTGLLPMPCVVCWEDIECWGGDTREVYEFSKAHRFVCCGADARLICKMQFLSQSRPKCRACDCYLNPNTSFGLMWGSGLYFCLA